MEVSGRSWDFSPKKTTLARSASDSLSLRSFIYRKGSSPNNMFKCTVHPNFTHKIACFHVPHVGVSRTRLSEFQSRELATTAWTFRNGRQNEAIMEAILLEVAWIKQWLGGGFNYVLFSPLFGENSHFD